MDTNLQVSGRMKMHGEMESAGSDGIRKMLVLARGLTVVQIRRAKLVQMTGRGERGARKGETSKIALVLRSTNDQI